MHSFCNKLILITCIFFAGLLINRIYWGDKSDINLPLSNKKENVSVIKDSTENNPSDIFETCLPVKKLLSNKKMAINSKTNNNSFFDASFIHEIEKTKLENNMCSVLTLSFAEIMCDEIGQKANAKKYKDMYHKMLIILADQKNSDAMSTLCEEPLPSKQKQIHYCKMLLDASYNNLTASEHKTLTNNRYEAFTKLLAYYSENNDTANFIELSSNAKTSEWQYYYSMYGSILGEQLKRLQRYDELVKLYEKLGDIDETGITYSLLADMYLNGTDVKKNIPSSIFWYNSALEKMPNSNSNIRMATVNNLCVAYDSQRAYIKSFQCFNQNAIDGFPLSQMNLARSYGLGTGTIQDYQKAFAWISIAISKGLDNESQQENAIALRNYITSQITVNDKTGISLKESKALAKQYYNLYVMHEKPSPKLNTNFLTRLKGALNLLLDNKDTENENESEPAAG